MKELVEKNPGQERRGKRGDTDHVHLRVDVFRDGGRAEHAFRAMGYTGTDGAIVWKAAAWVNTGAITEGQFADAYNGVRVIEPAKSMAYFRSILKDTLGEARLTELERRTTLPRGFVAGPPARLVEHERERHRRDENGSAAKPEHVSSVLERSMKRVPQMSADELAEMKTDFKRQLEARPRTERQAPRE